MGLENSGAQITGITRTQQLRAKTSELWEQRNLIDQTVRREERPECQKRMVVLVGLVYWYGWYAGIAGRAYIAGLAGRDGSSGI